MSLLPPFPWYGGKRRWAPLVWERFGRVGVYSEPFAGSLAVLLHNATPASREIICDTDGGVCNFWRAVRADPEAVAHWADYPTIHQDLTARHRYLVEWLRKHGGRLEQDPDYYDARVAGWWVWGISLWIGGGWCQIGYRQQDKPPERKPLVQATGGGKGVNVQTKALSNRRPVVQATDGGKGVSAQTKTLSDKRPYVADHASGRGIARQRNRLPSDQISQTDNRGGGSGVSAQRNKIPRTGKGVDARRRAQMPAVADWPGGQGVAAQRKPHDKTPKINHRGGGTGVSAQRLEEKRPSAGGTNSQGKGVNAQRSGLIYNPRHARLTR